MVEQEGNQTENVADSAEPPYSVLSERGRISLMMVASFAGMVSPLSSSIYFPSINTLARDLDVSVSKINLTISTYLIFQGVAPSVTAAFSETYGRRPAYLICFVVYLAANTGLALQTDYAALLVLRCLQSAGSSGTVTLGSAVVSDLSTRAERGKYMAYATMGVTLGPAIGPILGGVLGQSAGWRWIFWFLCIYAAVWLVVTIVFYRETCRAVVGNGSIPPPKWYRSIMQVVQEDFLKRSRPPVDPSTLQLRKRAINPLSALLLLVRDKETGLIAFYMAIAYACYTAVLSTFASQLKERYGFDTIIVGVCYLPLGLGTLTSRWTMGTMLDRNFKREAKKQGLDITKNQQQNIQDFNIEHARLSVTGPFLLASVFFLLAYGWAMQYRAPLPVILILLFFFGHLINGGVSSLNVLLVDINRETPAIATAASNLTRCLMAAAFVAAATPIINAIGLGWFGTICAAVELLFAPCLFYLVWKLGFSWRVARARKQEEAANQSTTTA